MLTAVRARREDGLLPSLPGITQDLRPQEAPAPAARARLGCGREGLLGCRRGSALGRLQHQHADAGPDATCDWNLPSQADRRKRPPSCFRRTSHGGGGKGQALAQIKRSLPELPAGRFVLQDREGTIKDAENSRPPELKSVKAMPHDFFEPQPVKGALVYILRRIMRDWSDKHNAWILGHCRYAMAPHSRILIVDQVMPNPPTTLPCQTDICMVDHIL